jgi:branched-subunit amino acid aminotransferase/4-amino-4-deoxychorismate lyase
MLSSKKYLYDGTITEESKLPNAFTTRGFLYADGFFESMRVINGEIPLLDLHHGRILDSIEAYCMDLPAWLESDNLKILLLDLIADSGIKSDARIRLTIFRKGDGKFAPESNIATGLASIESIDGSGFELNEKGIAIGLYHELTKTQSKFSNFKNLHSQLYIQAAIYAAQQGLSDVLILNDSNELIESTYSNIFLVIHGVLHTPKLESGAVGGVMRAAVINLAISLNIKVFESNLEPHQLLKVDEVFLTNAVVGIQWVASYRTKRYFNKVSTMLVNELRKKLELTG